MFLLNLNTCFCLDKRIDYYGDPLRDFGLPHFLERFSFKNPKKLDQEKLNVPSVGHKPYLSHGARGLPVKSLTRANCTEDEMFIFNFLEQKRKQSVMAKTSSSDDEGEDLKAQDVDDDEFEEYLDGFFGRKGQKKAALEEDDEELDFLKEFEGALGTDSNHKKSKSKKKADLDEDDDVEDIDEDWGDDDKEHSLGSDSSDDEHGSIDFNANEDDDDQSISMDEFEDNDESDENSYSDFDDDADDEPKRKKPKKESLANMNERKFAKKLKHSDG